MIANNNPIKFQQNSKARSLIVKIDGLVRPFALLVLGGSGRHDPVCIHRTSHHFVSGSSESDVAIWRWLLFAEVRDLGAEVLDLELALINVL